MNLNTSIFHPVTWQRCGSALIPTPGRVSAAAASNIPTFPFYPCPFLDIKRRSFIAFAKKKNSPPEPVLKPSSTEEVSMIDEEDEDAMEDDIFLEDLEDDELEEDEGYFEDEYFEDEAEPFAGDGAGGGGVSLAGTGWDRKALEIAEEVVESFNGELAIYAFRTLMNATIQVRIERLTNKSGSPSLIDIENFSTAYRAALDEAEAAGSISESTSLEVSSPGVERVVRIPQDMDRFKERNMYVKYVVEAGEITGSPSELDGVFRLVSFDSETSSCTWGLADVRVNREKSGKGRPLSKRQREWRLNTPLDSLRFIRLYSDI